MANSLQEQLLKAGLVTEEQLAESRAPKPRPERKRGPGGPEAGKARRRDRRRGGGGGRAAQPGAAAPAQGEATTAAAQGEAPAKPVADRARLGRIARDARLNRYTPEALARRERRRQLEALLAEHKRNDDKADIPHHFLRGKKVKHVYVTAEQHAELTAGSLSVLAHDGYHYLLAPEIAERAHALAPDAFLFRNDPGGAPRSAEAVDDVPDDIVW